MYIGLTIPILPSLAPTLHLTIHRIVSHLGAGQFGSVNKALWKSPTHKQPLEVAVKMMKASLQKNTRVKFLQEAAILGQFFHPNVVQLYGVITVGDPVRHCSLYVAIAMAGIPAFSIIIIITYTKNE